MPQSRIKPSQYFLKTRSNYLKEMSIANLVQAVTRSPAPGAVKRNRSVQENTNMKDSSSKVSFSNAVSLHEFDREGLVTSKRKEMKVNIRAIPKTKRSSLTSVKRGIASKYLKPQVPKKNNATGESITDSETDKTSAGIVPGNDTDKKDIQNSGKIKQKEIEATKSLIESERIVKTVLNDLENQLSTISFSSVSVDVDLKDSTQDSSVSDSNPTALTKPGNKLAEEAKSIAQKLRTLSGVSLNSENVGDKGVKGDCIDTISRKSVTNNSQTPQDTYKQKEIKDVGAEHASALGNKIKPPLQIQYPNSYTWKSVKNDMTDPVQQRQQTEISPIPKTSTDTSESTTNKESDRTGTAALTPEKRVPAELLIDNSQRVLKEKYPRMINAETMTSPIFTKDAETSVDGLSGMDSLARVIDAYDKALGRKKSPELQRPSSVAVMQRQCSKFSAPSPVERAQSATPIGDKKRKKKVSKKLKKSSPSLSTTWTSSTTVGLSDSTLFNVKKTHGNKKLRKRKIGNKSSAEGIDVGEKKDRKKRRWKSSKKRTKSPIKKKKPLCREVMRIVNRLTRPTSSSSAKFQTASENLDMLESKTSVNFKTRKSRDGQSNIKILNPDSTATKINADDGTRQVSTDISLNKKNLENAGDKCLDAMGGRRQSIKKFKAGSGWKEDSRSKHPINTKMMASETTEKQSPDKESLSAKCKLKRTKQNRKDAIKSRPETAKRTSPDKTTGDGERKDELGYSSYSSSFESDSDQLSDDWDSDAEPSYKKKSTSNRRGAGGRYASSPTVTLERK